MNTSTIEGRIESSARAARPFYTRLAALGFALIALTGLVGAVYALFTGANLDSLDFLLALLVIGLLIAGGLMRFGAWAQVLAALLSFLLLATVLPFSLFILQHPEDASNFIPLVLLLVGAALGFVGSIVGLVERRRHTVRAAATRAESFAVRAILAALVLIAVVSVALSLSARTTVAAEVKATALGVEVKSFSFNPNHLQVKAGGRVRIVVTNNDPTLHTFTLPDAGIDMSVPPGSERLIEFQAPAPGTYRWYCIPHSDPGPNGTRTGMVGVLTVQ